MIHILMLGLAAVAAIGGIGAAITRVRGARRPTLPGIVGAWAAWMVLTRVEYNVISAMQPGWRVWLGPLFTLGAVSISWCSAKLLVRVPAESHPSRRADDRHAVTDPVGPETDTAAVE